MNGKARKICLEKSTLNISWLKKKSKLQRLREKTLRASRQKYPIKLMRQRYKATTTETIVTGKKY